IVVGEGRLRISKAEGRPPGAQGQLFRYSVKDGGLQLQPAQAAARVGAALRAYRLRRDLSQSDLARLAGVSPSAISQVERGERGLSLETLMALSGRLNVTLDELLGGEVTPDYAIGYGRGSLRPQGRRTGRSGQRPYPGAAVIGPSRPPPRRNAPRLPPRDRRLAQHGRGRRAVPVGPAGLSAWRSVRHRGHLLNRR